MIILLIAFLVVLALVYWLITLLPIPDPFRQIINVLFILLAVLYVLDRLGLFHTGLV